MSESRVESRCGDARPGAVIVGLICLASGSLTLVPDVADLVPIIFVPEAWRKGLKSAKCLSKPVASVKLRGIR